MKVKALLTTEQERSDCTLQAVINGVNRGVIYVDNPHEPLMAVVYAVGLRFFFIGGVPDKSKWEELGDFIFNQLKDDSFTLCGGTWFSASLYHEGWKNVLEQVAAHKGATIEYDCTYQRRFDVHPDRGLPKGYSLEKMNAAHARNALVHPEFIEYWYSIEDFMEMGIGYVMKQDEDIVCVCYSCSVNGNEHELYIATFSDANRGQGLATYAAAAYLNQCAKRNVIARWTTDEANQASKRVAEKIGFYDPFKVPVLECSF
ncbi:hypothetical protein JOC54_003018 [Alkalihalobacillus xiaoxiensis]|uniref:GNAT acetyltransferase-like protein n=1 Tax=Shouchella xiaoxiensis TaxID=766895 RepID=A0ABS2SW23_9BACI|nr:hypothetical protein [Shouchella xiaoxiensis]